MEFTRAISPEQAVIDNDILSALQRIKKGIEVSEETLALDLIQQMESRPNYLPSEFTLRHFRKELATLSLVNRHRRSVWEKRGAKTLEEAAKDQVGMILQKLLEPCSHEKGLDRVRAIEKRWLEKIAK